MSVCASVVCVTCGIGAPGIGDFGHLGYPSLDDDEWCHGDLASFEYLYKGWAAIGFLPKELEAIRAFLVAHKKHEVGLLIEGEEYADRFPPVAITSKPAPALPEQGFVNGHFELDCDRCKASFLTQAAEWLRPIESRKVAKAKLDAFTSRVLDADGANFHRITGGRVIAFGVEYEGSRERALALCELRDPARPVWRHAYTDSPAGDRSFERFAVAAGQIYTEWGEDLVALRLSDGEVTWRRSLAEFGARSYRLPSPVSVSNDTILLDTNNELLALDAANGDLRWRRERVQGWLRTVCDGVIYAAEVTQMVDAPPGTLVAIDVVTGREVARIDAGSAAFAEPPPPRPHFASFPVIGLTHVFVNDRNGRIWALDKTTLEPQWMTRPKGIDGAATQMSVAYDDRLLLKSRGGRLFCFEGARQPE